MRNAALILALFALLLMAGAALAKPAPLVDFGDFRYISALPGNGFGVTPEGRAGFDGALQMNIPVAYTPSSGNWMVGGWVGSTETWKVNVDTQGPKVNGAAFVAAGFGPPGHGLYLADMLTSSQGDPCYNIQYQLTRDNSDRPALAIGILDFTDRRDSAPDVGHNARSFYGVVTHRVGSEKRSAYVSLGYGSGKFNSRPFGGISWPVSDNITLLGEYDGFQLNTAIALSPFDRLDDSRWNAVFLAGLAHMDRPNVGLCITYAP